MDPETDQLLDHHQEQQTGGDPDDQMRQVTKNEPTTVATDGDDSALERDHEADRDQAQNTRNREEIFQVFQVTHEGFLLEVDPPSKLDGLCQQERANFRPNRRVEGLRIRMDRQKIVLRKSLPVNVSPTYHTISIWKEWASLKAWRECDFWIKRAV
jgi:hypothetical protein